MPDPITHLNAALEGRYHIERELGEGGMATVYLADDLKHERKVALKVLKPELAAVVGAERFLAEIKTTAGLQHPHILPLHDSGEGDGWLYYVMPFVEGESLRDQLEREKQLSVEEAVKIATDLAEALDYAHRRSVIHRDIKPANILLHEGRPFIADFGIALAVSAAGGGRLTETGLSLGTPHYMSPEQATGDQHVGPGVDVYALGCVLYEMLVGEPPYTGSTPQAILGKIITGDPEPVTKLRPAVPANVDAAIRKALQSVPADRFSRAIDLAHALGEPSFRYGQAKVTSSPGPGPWKKVAATFATLFVATAIGLVWSVSRPGSTQRVAVFESNFRPGQTPTGAMEFTPDGSALVYVGANASGDGFQLWIRRLDDPEARPIPGTESVSSRTYLELSPDGEEVAFASANSGPLLLVPLEGGPARELAPSAHGAHGWSSDGYVYYQTGANGISRVRAIGGGSPEIVTEQSSDALRILPGGRTAVFTNYGEIHEIRAIDLETLETKTLAQGYSPRYTATGHLLYVSAPGGPNGHGVLMAAPIDSEGEVGPSVSLFSGVRVTGGVGHYAISADGTLAFATEEASSALVWVDREGREQNLPFGERNYESPRISPDGRRVATAEIAEEQDLWVLDLERLTRRRITFGGNNRWYPVWSATGDEITTSSGGSVVYSTSADGNGQLDTLLSLDGINWPTSQSRDGRFLALGRRTESTLLDDIWVVSTEDEPVPFLRTPFRDLAPAFSPDGRWLAYVSNKSGRNEVYVQPFPGQGPERILSTDGGSEPVWSPDGSEVFYRGDDQMMVVDVSDPDGPGVPLPIWTDPYERADFAVPNYDIHPDGRRFLMVKTRLERRVTLVLNWFEELREQAPS